MLKALTISARIDCPDWWPKKRYNFCNARTMTKTWTSLTSSTPRSIALLQNWKLASTKVTKLTHTILGFSQIWKIFYQNKPQPACLQPNLRHSNCASLNTLTQSCCISSTVPIVVDDCVFPRTSFRKFSGTPMIFRITQATNAAHSYFARIITSRG